MTSTTLRPVLIGVASVIAIALLALLIMTPTDSLVTPTSNGIGLLIPVTFLAGLFSFLSPCTLPILPAYFAFTFQAKRERVTIMSIAFFLGLATTIVVLGASATALSRFLFGYLSLLTSLGGVLIIVFGVMSFFGIGFSGMQLLERPVGGIVGSYLYGATFALGWSACVGPILGALLTMLATQGIAVAQGALLAFVYALGLGTPLIIISTYFSRLGNGSKFWQVIKGKAYFVTIGGRELMLHTTSMASGVLLVLMGVLLATGNLATIGEWSRQSALSEYSLQFESWLQSLISGR
ncbi:MAG: cytochrome c biogenesis protein CcdA [Chloroflexi bacterium]|nr:MAG: cytochrome c biogenesis protein CcdA [Chloroflexota bacterium]RLT33602.1 MAG: cytochrome c biogenesis protein CcdA [Chloroflexota bacterium]